MSTAIATAATSNAGNIRSTTTTRVFQNGNSQALRIPQELRTEKKESEISILLILPMIRGHQWTSQPPVHT